MKKAILIVGILAGSISAFAEEPSLQCSVSQGSYSSARLIMEWDSSKVSNPFPQFKYYGAYQDGATYETSTNLYAIWGVNIGAGASPDSHNRFQILAYGLGKNKGINVAVDTDATKPIDIAVYVPGAGISIRCHGNQ